MERTVIKVKQKKPLNINNPVFSTLRVAAYARVSTSSEEQLQSLEAQKKYYESYISTHSDWVFAGLYVDEGISGLSLVN